MSAIDISFSTLALAYLLLIIPISIILWLRVPVMKRIVVGIIRMTLQLLFVGFYLQVVFDMNNLWITFAWLAIMIIVADISIARGCGLRLRNFSISLFLALIIGASVPLFFFVGIILKRPNLLDAQYAIPIGGMILGNCLRGNIIALKTYYQSLKRERKLYEHYLSQGAKLSEATRPFLINAVESALAPTLASIATIGLVALPGMMTGVIMGGANPLTAIKYQIAIMIAILTGTALSVTLSIILTTSRGFDDYGILKKSIFTESKK